jgi:hypothetical protein
MRQVSIFLRIEAEAASVPQGKLPPMAEKQMFGADPSNPMPGWVRPMNPFRRWRDEPVGRAATERFTGRLNGRVCDEAKPCSEVAPSRNGTGIDRH